MLMTILITWFFSFIKNYERYLLYRDKEEKDGTGKLKQDKAFVHDGN